MDIIELNEAFAAQALACTREMGIADDDPRVNPNGGRIASSSQSFLLTILPNDNPHGFVQFASAGFMLYEQQADSTQYIKINRT